MGFHIISVSKITWNISTDGGLSEKLLDQLSALLTSPFAHTESIISVSFLIYEGRERLQINSKSKIPGLSLFLFLILWNSFEYRAVFVIPQTNICMKVTWSYKHETPKDKNDFTFPSFLQGIVRIADSRDVFNQKHKPSFLANENQKM